MVVVIGDGGYKPHVFFCRFRVPAPVVLVDGVLDREAFTDVFSSFWTSSIARFCRLRVRNVPGSGFGTTNSHLASTGRPLLDPIDLLSLGLLLNHTQQRRAPSRQLLRAPAFEEPIESEHREFRYVPLDPLIHILRLHPVVVEATQEIPVFFLTVYLPFRRWIVEFKLLHGVDH